MPGATIPVWSTDDTSVRVFNRIDADDSEVDRTEPSIIEQITAKNAEQDIRLNNLETGGGGTGGVSQEYVDTQDDATLQEAKTYTDTELSGKSPTTHTHDGLFPVLWHGTQAEYHAISPKVATTYYFITED